MHHHRPGRDNKRVIGRNCKWYPDGMAAAQHQRNGWHGKGRDHLCNGKPCIHIPTGRIQKNQQAFHTVIILQLGKPGQNLIVFGNLRISGQIFVPLYFPDDGKQMDFMFAISTIQRSLRIVQTKRFISAVLDPLASILHSFHSIHRHICFFPFPGIFFVHAIDFRYLFSTIFRIPLFCLFVSIFHFPFTHL